MRLSTKTRYGTRALLDLAIHGRGNSPVPLKDIAERQEFSLPYLEHIVAPLIAAGIIQSVRGAKGGIYLIKKARDITLKEVVDALEGCTELVGCLSDSKACPRDGSCATQEIWGELGRAISRVLESTTLQDLVDKQNSKGPATDMFYI